MTRDEHVAVCNKEIEAAKLAAELNHWNEAERLAILLWECDWTVTLADLNGEPNA